MKQRDITYISISERLKISEHRRFYFDTLYFEAKTNVSRSACVEECKSGKMISRIYSNISEASILRLAKIQEKLVK